MNEYVIYDPDIRRLERVNHNTRLPSQTMCTGHLCTHNRPSRIRGALLLDNSHTEPCRQMITPTLRKRLLATNQNKYNIFIWCYDLELMFSFLYSNYSPTKEKRNQIKFNIKIVWKSNERDMTI